MIKLFYLLICILSFIKVEAQHAEFKNIPITGTVHQFSQQLLDKNYTILSTSKGEFLMLGNFANKSCTIYLLETLTSRTIWGVGIIFNSYTNWKDLKYDFDDLVRQYSNKYGTNSDRIETYQYPYKSGDGNELEALINGKLTLITKWEIPNGTVKITATTVKSIIIIYEDYKGIDIYFAEKDSLIIKDL